MTTALEYSIPLPLYDLVVYDDDKHCDTGIEVLFHEILQLSKPDAKTKLAELRANGVVRALRTYYERGEHYHALLCDRSAAMDVTQGGVPLFVELKEVYE